MAKKVLTVDDSKTMRSIVKKQIMTLGYDALEAADGAEGLQVAAAEKPDLILLDVTMPVMDGRQALIKLRQQPETAKIPVIMVTAEAAKATVVEIIKAGVSDYIVKPFSEAALGEKINKVLKANSAAAEKIDVVVVDSNGNNFSIIQGALQAEHAVHLATTGEQALDKIMTHRPRLILIDIGMPDTIRLQVVDKLKTADLLPRCKLVALCNKNSIDEVGRASQKGFTGVLLKPFQGEEARTLINNILQTQTQFACRKGDIFVLHYPTKDEVVLFSVFRQLLQGWQQWLGHLAAGGHTKVVIDIAQAATIGIDDLRFFRELAGKASELGIGIVFVVGEPKSFELRHFWESGVARSTATLEEAKKFFQQ